MPADGRYLVYPKFDRFFVKGQEFGLEAFLQDPVLSRRFSDGAMVVARLCPVDYHRFHFPCSGVALKPRLINGPLYSVSPIALKRWVQILSENKRVVTEVDTEKFGTMLYVEIGATAVGTIRQTFVPNAQVEKGQEKGYFEFGGSCVVLLFEKNQIRFDEDLVQNTKNGFETLCRFGTSLGSKFYSDLKPD
jgi:phosphatidylserine decarboxylase